MEFVPYTVFLFISSLIMLSLGIYAYIHRVVPGARFFLVSMVIGVIWSLGNALEISGTNLATKLFWANMQYITYTTAPVAWLLMVFQFSGREHLVRGRNIALLLVIPMITLILVWTDRWHGFVRHNFQLVNVGPFSVIKKEYGFWFFVHFTYSYMLNGLSVLFLFGTVWRKNTVYRRQALFLLLGLCLIIGSNVIYVFGISPFPFIDFSPITFSLSGIIIGWGIFRHGLFSLIPIARSSVFEWITNGIIVIDNEKKIIDINPAAKNLLNLQSEKIFGVPLSRLVPQFGEVVGSLNNSIDVRLKNNLYQTEIEINQSGNTKYFQLHTSLIYDYRNNPAAWVIIFTDVTRLNLAGKEIIRQKQELAVLQDRDRLARDLHDNLGQILSFISLQTQSIFQELQRGNTELAQSYSSRLLEIVTHTHMDLRHYVYDIRTAEYMDHSLSQLIRRIVTRIPDETGMKVEFSFPDELEPLFSSTEMKRQLVLLSQEAIQNATVHAGATVLAVGIRASGERLEYYIQDNGRGIEPAVFRDVEHRGSGLEIIRERAQMIGGRLSIESQPGTGTSIKIAFPLHRGEQ